MRCHRHGPTSWQGEATACKRGCGPPATGPRVHRASGDSALRVVESDCASAVPRPPRPLAALRHALRLGDRTRRQVTKRLWQTTVLMDAWLKHKLSENSKMFGHRVGAIPTNVIDANRRYLV